MNDMIGQCKKKSVDISLVLETKCILNTCTIRNVKYKPKRLNTNVQIQGIDSKYNRNKKHHSYMEERYLLYREGR